MPTTFNFKVLSGPFVEKSLSSHEADLIRIIVRLVLPADVVNISGDWSKWESLRSYQVLKATKLNFPNQITKIPHFNCWWVANGAVMVVHCADCSNVGPVQGNEAPPSHQITHLVGVETNWWSQLNNNNTPNCWNYPDNCFLSHLKIYIVRSISDRWSRKRRSVSNVSIISVSVSPARPVVSGVVFNGDHYQPQSWWRGVEPGG